MTMHRFALALLAGLMIVVVAPAAEVRGVITRIDPDKKELELEGRGRGVRGAVLLFTLPDPTPVTFGDQPGTLSDLEVGRRVRVEYEVSNGRQTVQMIHVLGGPRPVAATTPAPATASGADMVTGVLRHIGYSDREVTVIGPGAKGAETETTLTAPESARITKDGKEATLDDLKEGETATVQVETKDGHAAAVSIQVGPAAATAQPKGKAIPRLRLLLKIADQVLQDMQNKTDQ